MGGALGIQMPRKFFHLSSLWRREHKHGLLLYLYFLSCRVGKSFCGIPERFPGITQNIDICESVTILFESQKSTYSFASRFLRQKVPDSWPLKHCTCLYGDITIFLWRSCPVLWDTDHCPLHHHIFVIAGRKMLRDLKRNGDIAPSWSDTKNRFWGESDQLIKAKNVTPCRSKVSLKATCCSSF
jgi:hypothetical protein